MSDELIKTELEGKPATPSLGKIIKQQSRTKEAKCTRAFYAVANSRRTR
jgi:hypothetical protein